MNTEKNLKTVKDFPAETLECTTYDVKKFLTPFWKGNVVYNECIFPIFKKDGSLPPFDLLYKASEIVSVYDYTLTEKYTEGKDYVLEDGKLRILPEGSIKVIDYEYMHPSENPEEKPADVFYPHRSGKGFEYWNESSELSLVQICVTYVHNDTWDAPVPPCRRADLPKTVAKLEKGASLKVVSIGDSVTCGAKSSLNCNIPPYADAYMPMLVKGLSEMFGNDNITLVNSAQGGTISDYPDELLQTRVLDHEPDLLIVAYGMNDSSHGRVGITDDHFRGNMTSIIERVKKARPDCEIILVASVYGNCYTFPQERYESHARILHEVADRYEGVAACDPQEIEKKLLEKKDFLDFMSDNMVHPNDFGMRLIAQTILHSIYDGE